jgi:hypothetical protein
MAYVAYQEHIALTLPEVVELLQKPLHLLQAEWPTPLKKQGVTFFVIPVHTQRYKVRHVELDCSLRRSLQERLCLQPSGEVG